MFEPLQELKVHVVQLLSANKQTAVPKQVAAETKEQSPIIITAPDMSIELAQDPVIAATLIEDYGDGTVFYVVNNPNLLSKPEFKTNESINEYLSKIEGLTTFSTNGAGHFKLNMQKDKAPTILSTIFKINTSK